MRQWVRLCPLPCVWWCRGRKRRAHIAHRFCSPAVLMPKSATNRPEKRRAVPPSPVATDRAVCLPRLVQPSLPACIQPLHGRQVKVPLHQMATDCCVQTPDRLVSNSDWFHLNSQRGVSPALDSGMILISSCRKFSITVMLMLL